MRRTRSQLCVSAITGRGRSTWVSKLGKLDSHYVGDYSYHSGLRASGWMIGLNGTYRFDSPWYVSARGGMLRSMLDRNYSYQNLPYGPLSSGFGSASGTGTGWYAGMGGGYDFTEKFSVGLQYDNYHVKARLGGDSLSGSISAFTIQAEYRY